MIDSNKNTNIRLIQHGVCNFCDFGKGICLHFRKDPLLCNYTFIFFFWFPLKTLVIHRRAEEWSDRLYSFLPLPPAHRDSDIYLQLFI